MNIFCTILLHVICILELSNMFKNLEICHKSKILLEFNLFVLFLIGQIIMQGKFFKIKLIRQTNKEVLKYTFYFAQSECLLFKNVSYFILCFVFIYFMYR